MSGAGVGGNGRRVRATPGFDAKHGRLPLALFVLTFVTGSVDAVSILALGRVFVGNMTGNIVFLAFAAAGARGFSLVASLSALGGFVIGGLLAGEFARRIRRRTAVFVAGCFVETFFCAVAVIILFLADAPVTYAVASTLAALLAVALGMQNGVVRTVGVPDLTTTVLTMTLTGVLEDLHNRTATARRLVAVGAMFAGGAVGALLTLHAGPQWALLLAFALIAATTAGAAVLHRGGLLAED